MHVQIASAFEMDGKPCWSVIDGILQLLESEERAKLARLKHYERIYTFFVQVKKFIYSKFAWNFSPC